MTLCNMWFLSSVAAENNESELLTPLRVDSSIYIYCDTARGPNQKDLLYSECTVKSQVF